MIKRSAIMSSLVTLGVFLGIPSGEALAEMPHQDMQPMEQPEGFQRIDQPLWLKTAVTAAGLGLIGLELWWFLFSQPQARKTSTLKKVP